MIGEYVTNFWSIVNSMHFLVVSKWRFEIIILVEFLFYKHNSGENCHKKGNTGLIIMLGIWVCEFVNIVTQMSH